MAKKRKLTEAEDVRRGRARFIDQPGQWQSVISTTAKKQRSAEFAKIQKEMDARLAKKRAAKKK